MEKKLKTITLSNKKVLSKERYSKSFVIDDNPKNVVETCVDNDEYSIVFRRDDKDYVFVDGKFSKGARIIFGRKGKDVDNLEDLRLRLMSMKQLKSYNIQEIWKDIKPTREIDFSIIDADEETLTYYF